MMRLVWLSVLLMDAMLCAVVDEFLAHILATLVIACSLDAEAQGILSICLVRFEGLKSVALALEVGHGPKTRGIVHKHHPVEVPFRRGGGELALEVSVDQGKSNKFPGGETRDGVAIELASKAWLADGRRGALRADGEARDEALRVRRAEVVKIDMGATLVPKREV